MSQWWIEAPRLLGSHNPTDDELEQLQQAGFSVLVSFLHAAEQTPRYDPAYIADLGYKRYTIPVKDFAPPTLTQLETFAALVQQLSPEQKMIIHCEGGRGRTGTFAAAYWIAQGMSATAAIAHIRQMQPHAIETPEQQAVLAQYAEQRTGSI